MPHWIVEVHKVDIVELAETLGLAVEDGWLSSCPRCGDEAGAELYSGRRGWQLWRCDACGVNARGNLDLVAYTLAGRKAGDLDDEAKALLRQFFVDNGWCDPD